MLWILVAMLLVLVVAGAVVLYVAYPHRGQDLPGAPWLGDAMKRGVDAMPALPAEFPRQEDRLAHHPDQVRPESAAPAAPPAGSPSADRSPGHPPGRSSGRSSGRSEVPTHG